MPVANRLLISVSTAGSRLFIAAEVLKTNSQRSSCAASPDTRENKTSSRTAAKIRRAVEIFFGNRKFIMPSARTGKTVSFGAVVIVQVFLQVRQRILDHADEVRAACHRAAEAAHRVALRKIVRHHPVSYTHLTLPTI